MCPVPSSGLVIRPVAPEDKAALSEGFERFNGESRYRRFLSPHERLSASELRYFTEVDHHDHEALIAFDPLSGHGVGVARYVRSQKNREVAEVAVAVVDDWQGCGVGTQLTQALADRARQEGIRTFTAVILAENDRMLSVAKGLGEVRILQREYGTVELTIGLPQDSADRLVDLLHAVAAGELRPSPPHRRG